MRRLLLLALAALAAIVAACSTAGFDVELADAAPSPLPTAFAGIPTFGTGTDGAKIVLAGEDTDVNICHQIVGAVAAGATALSIDTDDYEGARSFCFSRLATSPRFPCPDARAPSSSFDS